MIAGTQKCGKIQSWLKVVALVLVIGIGTAQAGENARDTKIPKGGTIGKALSIFTFVSETWDALRSTEEIENERTLEQETDTRPNESKLGSESDPIAQFFGIPEHEYTRWPERWQRVLKQVHSSPERFRRRTIHTLTMFHASDWVLVEKIAPYVIEGRLFGEKASERGSRQGDIGISELLELEAIDIVAAANGFISTTLKPRSENELYHAWQVGSYGLVTWFRDMNHVVTWDTTPITRTGRELVALLRAKPNTEYLHKLGEGFAEHGIRTELWEVTPIPGTDQIRLDKRVWAVIPKEDVGAD